MSEQGGIGVEVALAIDAEIAIKSPTSAHLKTHWEDSPWARIMAMGTSAEWHYQRRAAVRRAGHDGGRGKAKDSLTANCCLTLRKAIGSTTSIARPPRRVAAQAPELETGAALPLT